MRMLEYDAHDKVLIKTLNREGLIVGNRIRYEDGGDMEIAYHVSFINNYPIHTEASYNTTIMDNLGRTRSIEWFKEEELELITTDKQLWLKGLRPRK